MTEFISLDEYRRQLAAQNPPGDDPPPPADAPPSPARPAPEWADLLLRNGRKEARPVVANVLLPLKFDPLWQGAVRLDAFSLRLMVMTPLPWERDAPAWKPRPWTDIDAVRATEWMQRYGEIPTATKAIVEDAINSVAADNPFHPVKEYLDGLKWDGIARIDTWLKDYCGVIDNIYTRAVASKFFIGAVARIYRPACQLDTMMILEGAQGIRKSSMLRMLFSPWFTDHLPDINHKIADAMMQISGCWCVEVAEMDTFQRAEVNTLKKFLTSVRDRFRPPYGRSPIEVERQSLFVGTMNPSGNGYFKDATGGRRFWPVRCGPTIDIVGIKCVRNQLFAEAVSRFNDGETWFMHSDELKAAAANEVEERFEEDARDEIIYRYIEGRIDVSVGEILSDGLGIADRGKWSRADQMMVAKALQRAKWERKKVWIPGGRREWRYRPSWAIRDDVGDVTNLPLTPQNTVTNSTPTPYDFGISGEFPSHPKVNNDENINGNSKAQNEYDVTNSTPTPHDFNEDDVFF